MRRALSISAGLATAAALAAPLAAAAVELAPLIAGPGAEPPAPWAFAGLPQQTLPRTRFVVEALEGERVLRIEADGAYGNLVHPLAAAPAGLLRWRWRLGRALPKADLRTRAGDDAALKVCAVFAMPRERVPFFERELLRMIEARAGEPLPNATLCYVWDSSLPAGSVLANAYSRRVRYIALGDREGAWREEQRDLAADFQRAFGDESPSVPPLQAIGVGADADNTGGSSLGWIGAIQLTPRSGF